MVQIYSLCGKWKRNENSQLEFVPHPNRFASFTEIDENVTYNDFIEMVIEDLRIDSQDITLSYELPMKYMLQNPPPVYIRNDRQLTTFFNKIKESHKLIPLCVTVNDKGNMASLENVGTNIESKTIHNEDNVLQNLDGHSYVDESSDHEKQQVNDKGNIIALENVGTNIESKTLHNGQNCDLERHTDIALQNLDDHSYVDESSDHEKQQQELHRSTDSEAHNDRYENGNHPFRFHPILSPCPLSVEYPYSTRDSDGIHVNKCFKNKQELMLKMRKWALEWKFEFRSLWSDKSRVVLACVDDKCTWRMRATKLDSSSDVFVVKRYVHEHTCDTTGKSVNHKQATVKLVGALIRNNNGEGLKPKQIIEKVRREHGIEITYGKARRAKEQIQNLVRENPGGSGNEILCSSPSDKQSNERSTRKRMRSAGGSHKCSKCGREGHHKNTCEIPTDVEEEGLAHQM